MNHWLQYDEKKEPMQVLQVRLHVFVLREVQHTLVPPFKLQLLQGIPCEVVPQVPNVAQEQHLITHL